MILEMKSYDQQCLQFAIYPNDQVICMTIILMMMMVATMQYHQCVYNSNPEELGANSR